MLIASLPTLFLILIAAIGLAGRSAKIPFHCQAAALGGHALGVLSAWGLLALIRTFALLLYANPQSWLQFVYGFIPLYWSESLVMVAVWAQQLRFTGGVYNAAEEWKLSVKDGVVLATKFVGISSLLFLPTWWLLSPGEFGVFRESIASPFVFSAASELFQTEASASYSSTQATQNALAIPHAIGFATFLACVVVLSIPAIMFVRRDLDREVLLPQPEENESGSIFDPRGGGRN